MPQPVRPYLIGVAGGTCAGKTMICERLAKEVGDEHVALIRLDMYQIDRTAQSWDERVAANYDDPSAYDWPLLNDHLGRLAVGESVLAPTYDFTVHNRSEVVVPIRPAPVVILEGILVLWEPALRDRFDLKIYIDADADVRFIRRLKRDVEERGRTTDHIVTQYLTWVRPGHFQYIEPTKAFADVVLQQVGLEGPAFDLLLARIRELTALSSRVV